PLGDAPGSRPTFSCEECSECPVGTPAGRLGPVARTHSVDDYLEAIYFLATPIGEYGPVVKEAPVPAARVAEMLHVTPPTASEMLKRLEAEGLRERGPRKGP